MAQAQQRLGSLYTLDRCGSVKGSLKGGQIFGLQLGCEPIPIFSMSLPLRIEYPGAVYHVMNRGSDRQKVERVRIEF